MNRISDQLLLQVKQILERARIEASVSVQGSFARDTWVSGDTDLDIFARFAPSMERNDWVQRVLPAIRKGLARFKVVERYAEHPFLEFFIDGIRVNVVPCYDVKKGEWKSATDRTPYHTEFMNANLTDDLRVEARLLKKFTRGIGVYGAEIKVGGFSGMLIDTLTLYYGTFVKTITEASSWNPNTLIEIGKPQTIIEQDKRERDAELVVIDPVDLNRNLASAVRVDKLWTFVAAGRRLLQNPGLWFFFPPTPAQKTRAQFAKRIGTMDKELLALAFRHPMLVQDVLWGQLQKLERSLVNVIRRGEFHVFRVGTWSNEKTDSAILLEVDRSTLSEVRLQRGPPISKKEDTHSFLAKHLGARDTARGPWVEGDRWVVEKHRREISISDLISASLRDQAYGLAIPKQIGESLPDSARILFGKSILSLLRKDSFANFFWDFLEAKPQWLKSSPS
jgi:tRNA nucleotidyltransferase (CCA-adding enzyme)